jgi:hypothetical protein
MTDLEHVKHLASYKNDCKNRLLAIQSEKLILEANIYYLDQQLAKLCPHENVILEKEWDGHKNNSIYTCELCLNVSWRVDKSSTIKN